MKKIKRHKKHRLGKHFYHRFTYFNETILGMVIIKSRKNKIITPVALDLIMKRNGWNSEPIILSSVVE